jgi:glycosyltransferase involved in cell wall biosynthesis
MDTERLRILQVFNRYLHAGGEEKSVERIYQHVSQRHDMARCFFDSADWKKPGAPGMAGQAARMFYNAASRARFESALDEHSSEAALFHNLYPVASPSLYRSALKRRLPVMQYLHNYRPFCVSGTVYARGQILAEAMQGNWWREVKFASWQDSVVKSALFAVMLKLLHASGWLRSVKAWIAISDFMRDRIIESGVPASQVHSLRHSWDAMPEAPPYRDAGHYLFLGRLVEPKGIAPLLAAWEQLRQHLGPQTPVLHIAGEGPLEPLVRQHAASNPSLRYLGLIGGTEKHEALSSCRALLVPSVWWEPMGLVVYEAYDFAKPVLAARSGGITEAVQPGVTGLLHPPGHVDSLVRDVLAMEAMDTAQRRDMGNAGRDWLLRETSAATWQDRFDEIVSEVLPVSRKI